MQQDLHHMKLPAEPCFIADSCTKRSKTCIKKFCLIEENTVHGTYYGIMCHLELQESNILQVVSFAEVWRFCRGGGAVLSRVADLNQIGRILKSNFLYSSLDEVQARGLVLSCSLPQRLLCVAGR